MLYLKFMITKKSEITFPIPSHFIVGDGHFINNFPPNTSNDSEIEEERELTSLSLILQNFTTLRMRQLMLSMPTVYLLGIMSELYAIEKTSTGQDPEFISILYVVEELKVLDIIRRELELLSRGGGHMKLTIMAVERKLLQIHRR